MLYVVIVACSLYGSVNAMDNVHDVPGVRGDVLRTDEIKTNTRRLNSAIYNMTHFAFTCPYGFVIPDNPDGEFVEYFADTPCATACAHDRRWTDHDLVVHDKAVLVLSWMGLVAL